MVSERKQIPTPVKAVLSVRTSQRILQRRKIYGRFDVKEVLKQRRRKLRNKSPMPVKKAETQSVPDGEEKKHAVPVERRTRQQSSFISPKAAELGGTEKPLPLRFVHQSTLTKYSC